MDRKPRCIYFTITENRRGAANDATDGVPVQVRASIELIAHGEQRYLPEMHCLAISSKLSGLGAVAESATTLSPSALTV